MPTSRVGLLVPIRRGQAVMGVLDVQSARLDAFTSDDIQVLEMVASQLALVIDAAGTRPPNLRGRRLVVALVDLTYDRLRKRELRQRTPLPLAEEHPVWLRRRVDVSSEDEALARLSVFEIRRHLSGNPRIAKKAERLWVTASTLVEEGALSQQVRNRLGHARRQLRQRVGPRLVA